MNKIIINPHHCSKEEYAELKEYLNNKAWDYKEIKTDKDKVGEFKNTLHGIIGLFEDLVHLMPQKGDISEDCQRTGILYAVSQLSATVNGIEPEDMIPLKE